MPNIKPLSDLRSYTSLLDEVTVGAPVYLTKNGRGKYVVLDIRDYERFEYERTLLSELERGKASASQGTCSTEEVMGLFADRSTGLER